MKITLLAADSLGTRSMATSVETEDLKIMIDPGVALSPNRFSLPPHPIELKRRDEQWQEIETKTRESDVVIITHFHRDHHNPDHPEIFRDKVVLLKDHESHINYHQKMRGDSLVAKIKPLVKKIEIGDARSFKFGKTKITLSAPLPHGSSEKLGFVISVMIEADDRFLFTSDVQGMVLKEHIDFVMKNRPRIVYLDGPNTPMLGYRYFQEDLEASLSNIKLVSDSGFCEQLICDHHLLRDPNWRSFLPKMSEKIETAASFSGKDEELFEAYRREIYKQHPVEKSGINVEN